MRKFNYDIFNEMPVIGILRNISFATVKEIIPIYLKAGFHTIEVTMNSDNAEEIIAYLSSNFKKLNVGAGTVCNLEDLHNALNAGATYIVTPILEEEVVKYCRDHNIAVFPGAYTPTEIFKASRLGATAVKVFPATQLGPNFIKNVLAPLNNVKLLPTGGVSIDNIESFFKAGAVGVGMGGSLFNDTLLKEKNFEGLFNHFKSIAKKVLTANENDKH